MKYYPIRFLAVIIFVTSLIAQADAFTSKANGIKLEKLRVEYLHNPEGIDMQHPRFSWVVDGNRRGIGQKGYQILVSSNVNSLTTGSANMWDSQQTVSDKSVNISYDGKKLQSDKTYYWKVRVQDQNNEWSNWSRIQRFHTGLMNESDWQGEWIGSPDTTISAPLLRKEFNANKEIKSAHVFISGLGYYELYLNGKKVGNHKLDPGTSNFNKRALYASYDVTNYLKSGDNAIGVWLGNGYFRMNRKRPFKYYGDRPQMIVQMNITYTDGSTAHVVSNTSWKTSSSPILDNSVYNGEVYDARKEKDGWDKAGYDDQDWKNAVHPDIPKNRKLSAQLMPPIRVTKTIYPVSMREPEKGVYVFDFGQNLTGWPQLFVSGAQGQKVTMKTAEVTRKDMMQMMDKDTEGIVDTVDASPDRTAKARDVYILSGEPGTATYSPRFTYHGFRYIQLEGYPGKPTLSSVAIRVAHSDVKQTGSFKSANGLFNQIHKITVWGQKSNLMSMPTDCPQRDERMGWMGDAHLSAQEAMHNFDMAAFYTNWLNLIQDEQNDDGSVPDIVPDHKWLPGTKVGTPAWQVAYPLIVWDMHEYYGDDRVIEQHYNSLKKWMGYMKSISNDYIITKGRGDWVPPKLGYSPIDGSVPITSTGYYYKSAQLMSKMADILGKDQDKAMYSKLAQNINDAFQQKFWNQRKGQYGTGSQMSNVFPLYLGIVPKNRQQTVVNDLVNNIEMKHNDHLWTGILGTKALVEALPEHNNADVLYDLTNQRTYPGWGYMVSKGSTTLWERWGGYRYFGADMNSLNHIMFGSIDEFFYKNLAGIQSTAPGFKNIVIRPSADIAGKKLNWAQASVKTIRGKVASKWKFQGGAVEMNISIPANSTATVSIPKGNIKGPFTVTESSKTVWSGQSFHKTTGIHSAKEDAEYVTFEVGSGDYSFTLSGK